MKMLRFFVVCTMVMASAPAAADEWRTAEAERLFGPEMSEEVACRAAERKAKDQALKAVTGERLSSEDLMVCSENNGNAKCDLNQYTWSVIDGDIKGVRNKTVHTEDAIGGYRKCVVSLEVNVGLPKGKADPGFDMAVALNASVYRDGDLLKVAIEPSTPMYVHVFQWLPHETSAQQVSRIFPNPYDLDNKFSGPSSVPTEQGATVYDFEVRFPVGLPRDQRIVDEYLMIVGTREDISFRETYTLEDFNARLLEISRADSRRIKRAYSVVRK